MSVSRCRVCKQPLREGDYIIPVGQWHGSVIAMGSPTAYVHLTHLQHLHALATEEPKK